MTIDPSSTTIMRSVFELFWLILIDFWPIWLILLIPALIRLGVDMVRRSRLARAGMPQIDAMDGARFEQYLEVLFRQLGYHVERTRLTGDYGADLVLTRDGVRTVVQAKRYAKNVGVRAVQEVVSAQPVYHSTQAMVVTNRGYTKQAQHLARKNGVALWDRDVLAKAILSVQKGQRTKKMASGTK